MRRWIFIHIWIVIWSNKWRWALLCAPLHRITGTTLVINSKMNKRKIKQRKWMNQGDAVVIHMDDGLQWWNTMIFLLKCFFHQWKIFILFQFERHYYLLALATQKHFWVWQMLSAKDLRKKKCFILSFLWVHSTTDNKVWYRMGRRWKRNPNIHVCSKKFLTFRSIGIICKWNKSELMKQKRI